MARNDDKRDDDKKDADDEPTAVVVAEALATEVEPEPVVDVTRELHDQFRDEFPWLSGCLYASQGTYAQAEAMSMLVALRDARKAQAF